MKKKLIEVSASEIPEDIFKKVSKGVINIEMTFEMWGALLGLIEKEVESESPIDFKIRTSLLEFISFNASKQGGKLLEKLGYKVVKK